MCRRNKAELKTFSSPMSPGLEGTSKRSTAQEKKCQAYFLLRRSRRKNYLSTVAISLFICLSTVFIRIAGSLTRAQLILNLCSGEKVALHSDHLVYRRNQLCAGF